MPEGWFEQLSKICDDYLSKQEPFTGGPRVAHVSLSVKIELQSDEAENAKAMAEAEVFSAERRLAEAKADLNNLGN